MRRENSCSGERLAGWRYYNWKEDRIYTLAEEDELLQMDDVARRDAGIEDWMIKTEMRVKLELTNNELSTECTNKCGYATTQIMCKHCGDFAAKAAKHKAGIAAPGRPRTKKKEVESKDLIHPFSKENKQWRGKRVWCLENIKPAAEMAISFVHVVILITVLKGGGVTAITGHTCALHVSHGEWVNTSTPGRKELGH